MLDYIDVVHSEWSFFCHHHHHFIFCTVFFSLSRYYFYFISHAQTANSQFLFSIHFCTLILYNAMAKIGISSCLQSKIGVPMYRYQCNRTATALKLNESKNVSRFMLWSNTHTQWKRHDDAMISILIGSFSWGRLLVGSVLQHTLNRFFFLSPYFFYFRLSLSLLLLIHIGAVWLRTVKGIFSWNRIRFNAFFFVFASRNTRLPIFILNVSSSILFCLILFAEPSGFLADFCCIFHSWFSMRVTNTWIDCWIWWIFRFVFFSLSIHSSV